MQKVKRMILAGNRPAGGQLWPQGHRLAADAEM